MVHMRRQAEFGAPMRYLLAATAILFKLAMFGHALTFFVAS
jgi:hypothetical protein